MSYKFIRKYSDFVLNETLKTHDIDLTIRNVTDELSLLKYDFLIKKINNKIHIVLNNINTTQILSFLLDNLNTLLIDRHGWFPSKIYVENINGLKNIFKYDENYILDNSIYLKSVEISYEPKFDFEVEKIDKVYHLTVSQFSKSISKFGLIPKSKNKLSNHLDRIYLCKDVDFCYKLISQMKIHYLNKKNIDNSWIIYEIDSSDLNLKLYKDPNYSGGFYCVENIPPTNIKIYDREKNSQI